MRFSGMDVHKVLTAQGVTVLHHANTVTTSCTFLHLRGLASRGYVEKCKLPQTDQYTDDMDKRFGIWDDVFTDGVDVHHRARRPNHYGPVLFKLPVTVLLKLPAGAGVMVTKKNPANWHDGEPDSEHYFQSIDELSAEGGYRFGDFGQHVVVRTREGILPFSVFPVAIDLDDPKRKLPDGTDAFSSALGRLQAAAKQAKIAITVNRHACQGGCQCVPKYAQSTRVLELF